jgi:hypothetical protein
VYLRLLILKGFSICPLDGAKVHSSYFRHGACQ